MRLSSILLTLLTSITITACSAGSETGDDEEVASNEGALSDVLDRARSEGKIGETHTGYMAFVGTPTGDLRGHVDELNLQRRVHYRERGQLLGLGQGLVAKAAACSLQQRLSSGWRYQTEDGVWHRKGSGPVVRYSFCGESWAQQ